MSIVIVPNVLRDAINAKLESAFKDVPEAEKDREILYKQLLVYFNEHGEVPDFSLIKNNSELLEAKK